MQEPQTEFKPNGEPQFAHLDGRRREKFPYEKDGDPLLNLRLRRSVSWLERAEKFYHSASPDPDMAFTCYWIAFNALYAKNPYTRSQGETASFKAFFKTVIGSDDKCKRAILSEINGNFLEPIKDLLNNEFVFEPFWKYQNGVERFENWKDIFAEDKLNVSEARCNQNVLDVLSVLFYRLYVVRNQIVHGNATWNGGRNYDQLRDGANIMAFLVPMFITSVMDNPKMDLGKPYYTLPIEAAQERNTTQVRE